MQYKYNLLMETAEHTFYQLDCRGPCSTLHHTRFKATATDPYIVPIAVGARASLETRNHFLATRQTIAF